MRIAVISPHADDAIWSVGEHMLSRPDDRFTILNVCGEIPPARTGFAEKYETLLAEHEEACIRGGWERIDGPFYDDAVRSESYRSTFSSYLPRWLEGALCGKLTSVDFFDEWWLPAGIHHPDHINVRLAAFTLTRPSVPFCVYEELPYRVLYPREAIMRVEGTELTGFGPLGPQLEAKRRLASVYVSQIGPEVERCIYVPERLWR